MVWVVLIYTAQFLLASLQADIRFLYLFLPAPHYMYSLPFSCPRVSDTELLGSVQYTKDPFRSCQFTNNWMFIYPPYHRRISHRSWWWTTPVFTCIRLCSKSLLGGIKLNIYRPTHLTSIPLNTYMDRSNKRDCGCDISPYFLHI